jgi:hypothetical protein
MRRLLGTRPLPRKVRVRLSRGPRAPVVRPTLNNSNIKPLFRMCANNPQTVLSGAQGDRFYYTYKGNRIMSFPLQQEQEESTWKDVFAMEKQLLDFASDSLGVDAQLVRQNVRLSGEAIRHNPNGFACLYGPWEDMRALIKPALQKKPDKRAALVLLNAQQGVRASTDWQALQRLLLEAGKRVFLPDSFLEAVSMSPRAGDGMYRLRSALSAIEGDAVPEDCWLLVLAEEGARRQGFTLPGGKRLLFETAHMCARRALREECGIDVEMSFDTPAVSLMGNDSGSGLVFLKPVAGDPLPVKTQHMTSYKDRFQAWAHIQQL